MDSVASYVPIVGIVVSVMSALAVAIFYGFMYFNMAPDATPQFQSVLGTVTIGSIILSILTYLALLQQSGFTQQIIIYILVFFPIVMSCLAFGISA
jgi:hypothetical protein